MSSAILAVLNGRTKSRRVPAHSGMRITYGMMTIEILILTILMMNIIRRMMTMKMIFLAPLIVRQVLDHFPNFSFRSTAFLFLFLLSWELLLLLTCSGLRFLLISLIIIIWHIIGNEMWPPSHYFEYVASPLGPGGLEPATSHSLFYSGLVFFSFP